MYLWSAECPRPRLSAFALALPPLSPLPDPLIFLCYFRSSTSSSTLFAFLDDPGGGRTPLGPGEEEKT